MKTVFINTADVWAGVYNLCPDKLDSDVAIMVEESVAERWEHLFQEFSKVQVEIHEACVRQRKVGEGS